MFESSHLIESLGPRSEMYRIVVFTLSQEFAVEDSGVCKHLAWIPYSSEGRAWGSYSNDSVVTTSIYRGSVM
jgi:hypothetical protein